MFNLYFSLIVQTIIISNAVISLMHHICLFWINIFAFAIFKLLSLLDVNSRLIILSLLREDDENDTAIYSMPLNRPRWWGTGIVSIPKHWSYKDDNPSSTPLSQRSRSFSFHKLKPLIITWGMVVFSVDPGAQWMASKKSFRNKRQCWFCIIVRTDNHYLSK